MATILGSFAVLWLVGLVVMAIGIDRAPEGIEDEDGFHTVWCNNSPDVQDVACVWGNSGDLAAA